MRNLARWYRSLGTSFCFAGFGVGCVLVGLTMLPMILFLSPDRLTRRRRVRRVVNWGFRILLATIRLLGLGRVEVEGKEWLTHAGGRLVLATHPNFLDVVVLLSLLPDADCVVKSGMLRNPFTRWFASAADYISNDDGVKLMEACTRALRDGQPLVLFPEGTRTVPGQPITLKRGAMQIAVRGDFEILPVIMHCTPPTLLKDTMWYEVPDRAWVLSVRICPPRALRDFVPEPSPVPGVMVRRTTLALQDFFRQQIAEHEHAH